jgi:hypothetical protein
MNNTIKFNIPHMAQYLPKGVYWRWICSPCMAPKGQRHMYQHTEHSLWIQLEKEDTGERQSQHQTLLKSPSLLPASEHHGFCAILFCLQNTVHCKKKKHVPVASFWTLNADLDTHSWSYISTNNKCESTRSALCNVTYFIPWLLQLVW